MNFICLLAFLSCATALATEMRLTHIESRRTKLMKAGLWSTYLKQKQLRRLTQKAEQQLDVTENVVNDYDDLNYVGKITIGSGKKQEFSVVLDTGSSNLWVTSISCTSRDCKNRRKYDPSKSKTYVEDNRIWEISYGDGSKVGGVFGTDIMTLGGIKEQQLVIKNQTFGEAVQLSGMENVDLDGILGLGFTALATRRVVPPFINAINQNLVDKDIFTVWLARRGMKEGVPGGVFTFGDYNHRNCGPEIATVPLTSATYWQFKMDAIGAGSYSSNKGWDVISDTGTSFIGGPANVVRGIATALGGQPDYNNNIYKIDCDANSDNIELYIGGKRFEIEPANYIVQVGDNYCAIGVFELDFGGYGPAWILGDTFIRQFCNIHYVTEQKIGFARSKPFSSDSLPSSTTAISISGITIILWMTAQIML